MGSRKLSIYSKNLKNAFLMLTVGFCLSGVQTFASDNVLQAIQIDGTKDSYNIILKSDDVAELRKTVQAPNKMILNLKGIRASKTINTIYNNTSNVDSVVVEPINDDSVKILIQADNAENAAIHFDTLKTPLGVLDNSEKQSKATDEITLSDPVEAYTPVYQDNTSEDENFSFTGSAVSAAKNLKDAFQNDRLTLLTVFGIFTIIVLSGIKAIKKNDNEIKVGLSQSLKDREVELYRSLGVQNDTAPVYSNQNISTPNIAGNYGVKAYQQGARNPYVTSEIQRPRPVAPAPSVNLQQVAQNILAKQNQNIAQSSMNNPISTGMTGQRPNSMSTKARTTNIDSMKFLESMTKIYEKNGRSDLAQGLKSNMKKAKISLS